MRELILACAVAGLLWLGLFSPWMAGWVPFWPAMTLSAGILATWAVLRDRQALVEYLRFRNSHVVAGLASAGALYGAFLVGHHLAGAAAPWAAEQVNRIYLLRQSASLALITLLLLVIAPAKELFCRGFVQRHLMGRWGPWKGYLAASALYAGVHVWALNRMLLAAALLCGLAWGWILLQSRSLWPGIISHVVWDVAIIVVFPVH